MDTMVEILEDGPGCGSEESVIQSPPSYRDQDRFLPMANIGRIMRKGVPQNGKIAKESKELVQECVSEFVSFITSEASVKCQKEKRKTINGDDLLWAMSILGFEHYVYPLKGYLFRYRAIEGESKGSAKDMGGSARKNGDKGLAPESSYSYSQSLSDALYANRQLAPESSYSHSQSLSDALYANRQVAPESSYSQSLSDALYANRQAQSQYMAAPVQGMK